MSYALRLALLGALASLELGEEGGDLRDAGQGLSEGAQSLGVAAGLDGVDASAGSAQGLPLGAPAPGRRPPWGMGASYG